LRCDNPIGQPFYELSEVDSSNNYAMQRVQAHLAGTVLPGLRIIKKPGKDSGENNGMRNAGKTS